MRELAVQEREGLAATRERNERLVVELLAAEKVWVRECTRPCAYGPGGTLPAGPEPDAIGGAGTMGQVRRRNRPRPARPGPLQ